MNTAKTFRTRTGAQNWADRMNAVNTPEWTDSDGNRWQSFATVVERGPRAFDAGWQHLLLLAEVREGVLIYSAS